MGSDEPLAAKPIIMCSRGQVVRSELENVQNAESNGEGWSKVDMNAVTDLAKLKTKMWIIVAAPSTASFGAVHNYLSGVADICGLSRTTTGLVGVMKKRKNVNIIELPE
eukprot:7263409-Heterocapsa_arctica.AAC.1